MDIEVSQLAFRYPRRDFQLTVPSLCVRNGTTAAVVGPSGCGKTTLLRLLAGIQVPETGKILLNGISLPELGESDRRAFRIANIGFVFQDFQLIEYLTVEENIRLPFRINPSLVWSDESRRRLEGLLRGMDMAAKRNHLPSELSQGEMQRVAIGRALLTEPRLVLADEPTGNLDPSGKDRIMDLLFRETKRLGSTLLVVTHEREMSGDFHQVIDFRERQTRKIQ